MATKLEIAESLTIAELRELAAAQDVNLAGLSTKDDIADAVAAGVAKADLEAYASGGDEVADEDAEKERDLAKVEAEAPTAQVEGGEERIVRANPETPTLAQVEASQQTVPAPEPIAVTVDGEEVELDAGDAAQAQQRAASKAADQQAHADLAEAEAKAAEEAGEAEEAS